MKTALESLDALEALARKIASVRDNCNGPVYRDSDGIAAEWEADAVAIVSELPEPVDPDLATARDIIAEAQGYDADGQRRAARYRKGDWDTDTAITMTVAALRRAREEGMR